MRNNNAHAMFAFALLPACLTGCAHKDENQRALETVYASRDRAVIKRDLATFMRVIPQDYVYVNKKGDSFDQSHESKKWRDYFNHSTSFESATTIQSVEGQGDRLEVNINWVFTRHYTGPDSGAADEVTSEFQNRDTWIKRSDKWFLILSEVKENHTTRNGVKVN